MSHSHVGMGVWDLPLSDLCGYDKSLHDSVVFGECDVFLKNPI